MNKKKFLGQFLTKNSDYILQNFEDYIYNKKVIDPFSGNKDLINWAIKHGSQSNIGYDIDKKFIDNKIIFYNDSLINPIKNLDSSFILTNPPYLNINQAKNNYTLLFQNNKDCKDLYHIALKNILKTQEGILILPINFLTSSQSKNIRELFFKNFKIIACNYFSNQVFNKTKINIISFYYTKTNNSEKNQFNLTIYPTKQKLTISLQKKYSYLLGGEELSKFYSQKIFNKIRYLSNQDIITGSNSIKLSSYNLNNSKIIFINNESYELITSNIILFSSISKKNNLINHKFLDKVTNHNTSGLISNKNSRNQIHIIFEKKVTLSMQQKLIQMVNEEISKIQSMYSNIAFVNYRDNNRKRIPFKLINQMLNYFLDKLS